MQIYDSGDYHINEELDYYVDLAGLATELIGISDKDIRTRANQVTHELREFVAFTRTVSGRFFHDSSQKTIEINLEKAQGIGIFYPYAQNSNQNQTALQKYVQDDIFPNLTIGWGWANFIENGLLEQAESVEHFERIGLSDEIQMLAPLMSGLYDDISATHIPRSNTPQDESNNVFVYLPVVKR